MRSARVTIHFAVALAASVALVGCGQGSSGPTSGSQTPVLGGTLTVARDADVETWDPAYLNENFSLWASEQIAATIVRATPDGKGFEPYVAKTWDTSPDGKVTTFHLDPNAKFCDGTQITSDDVAFSYTYEAAHIQNWQFPQGLQISTPDPATVVLTLPSAFAPFLSFLTLYGTAMISHNYANRVGLSALATKPLGSGPFCLSQWKKGEEIDLARNQYFWLKDASGTRLPYLDNVIWKVISDDNARVLALQSGAVQAIFPVPPSQAKVLSSAAGIHVGVTPLLGQATVWMSQKVPAFRDVKVRQALNYAVDRQAMVKAALLGYGLPATSCLYLANYTTDKYGYTYDLQKAKQLMASTAFASGFTVTVQYSAGNTVAQAALVVLKDNLAKVGVTVNITPVETGTFNTIWAQGNFEMAYNLGTNDIYDPAENLSFDMLPASVNAGSDAGYTGWSDPNVSALVLKGLATLDPVARAQVYDDLQKLYMSETPQLLLFNPEDIWAYQSSVHGWVVQKLGAHPFMNAWVSKS